MPEHAGSMTDTTAIQVARQPILDRDRKVQAYEILYRAAGATVAEFSDGDAATARVTTNAILDLGLDLLVGESTAFLNVTRQFLVAGSATVLPPDRVVIEVLEDVAADAEVRRALAELVRLRYRIALDDFVLTPETSDLVPYADIVKLDIRAMEIEAVERAVERLRRPGLRLLAEKVETYEEYVWCRDLGFDLFQGYFFCRPQVVAGQRIPENRLALIRLLARLHDPAVEIDDVEELVEGDLALSYRILKIANSPMLAGRTEVSSIRQAVMSLGLRKLQDWISVICLSAVDDKPHVLLETGLLRAGVAKALAALVPGASPEACFSAGLLSVLDAILDVPMSAVLEGIRLAPELHAALVAEEGRVGTVLAAVKDLERGNWDRLTALGIPDPLSNRAYADGLEWVGSVRALLGPHAEQPGSGPRP